MSGADQTGTVGRPSFTPGGEMADKKRTQRIGVWIDSDINQRFDAIVPHGMKSEVIRALMEVVTIALEKHGEPLVGYVLARKIEIVIPRKGRSDGTA